MRNLPLGAIFGAALCACSSTPSGLPSATLKAGPTTLALSDGGRSFTISRMGGATVSLPLDAFSLATVPELARNKNYNPYQAEPEEEDEGDWGDATWQDCAWRIIERASEQEITLKLGFSGGTTTRVVISSSAEERFDLRWTPVEAAAPIAYMRVQIHAGEEEAIFGLGEWEEANQRGHRRAMQIENAGLESGSNENHVPVPLLASSAGWGLFVASNRPGVFDVGKKDAAIIEATFGTAEDSDQGLTFHLYTAEHPLDLTRHYYELTGFPHEPAPWALGPWFWRDENDSQAQFMDDLDKLRDLDLATSGIWIDRPYATAVNTFDFNATQFPMPQQMIDRAHAMGLRVALWSTPYLEKDTGALLTDAETRGFFPPTHGIYLNKWGVPIDFTNPEAYSFWQDLIGRYTTMGIEGFKLDYGEDIVTGLLGARVMWQFHDGSTELTMHAGYTRLYHQVYQEKLTPSSSYLLCRTGRWGDQKNVDIIWPGDLDATFTKRGVPVGDDKKPGVGGLPVAVAYAISLGPSGFPLFGSDMGGYIHSPPSKELFIRWAEHSALSMVMNAGDSSSQAPWEFTADNGRDSEALDIYRVYARLHLRLFPYLWTYVKRLATDGRPIVRPLALAYPGFAPRASDVYMLGDNLLVAPVVTDGERMRSVPLPPGDWINWWDGTVLAGDRSVDVPAPIDRIPLLLRAGGIVPMLRPTIDSLSPTTEPARVDSFATAAGVLYARAFAKAAGELTLYDGSKITVAPGQVTTHGGSTFNTGMHLDLVGQSQPTQILVDGAPSASWVFDAALGGTISIDLPAGDHSLVIQ